LQGFEGEQMKGTQLIATGDFNGDGWGDFVTRELTVKTRPEGEPTNQTGGPGEGATVAIYLGCGNRDFLEYSQIWMRIEGPDQLAASLIKSTQYPPESLVPKLCIHRKQDSPCKGGECARHALRCENFTPWKEVEKRARRK
jgi:hypothetical protein